MDMAAFLVSYPAFSTVPADTLDVNLVEAARFIDERYGDDRARLTGLYAAHRLSLAGVGPQAGAAALVGVKSISSGSLSLTKDDRLGDFGLTSYGRELLAVLRSYVGMFVTPSGDLPDGTPNPHAWHGSNSGA